MRKAILPALVSRYLAQGDCEQAKGIPRQAVEWRAILSARMICGALHFLFTG